MGVRRPRCHIPKAASLLVLPAARLSGRRAGHRENLVVSVTPSGKDIKLKSLDGNVSILCPLRAVRSQCWTTARRLYALRNVKVVGTSLRSKHRPPPCGVIRTYKGQDSCRLAMSNAVR